MSLERMILVCFVCADLLSQFETLPYGVVHLASASPESLCQLDVQVDLLSNIDCIYSVLKYL